MQADERELQIEEVVQPVLRDRGLTLVDLEWRAYRPRGVLRVYVDKPGGVGIEDCQRASRELGDVLDASALIEEGYDLEVSSPGLDRQLRKDREFRWALGKRVQCWVAGGQEFRGRLVDVDAGRLTLDHDGERVEVARERVTKAKLEAEVPWPRRPAV
jgi:ribosome maturation factor RimP